MTTHFLGVILPGKGFKYQEKHGWIYITEEFPLDIGHFDQINYRPSSHMQNYARIEKTFSYCTSRRQHICNGGFKVSFVSMPTGTMQKGGKPMFGYLVGTILCYWQSSAIIRNNKSLSISIKQVMGKKIFMC